MTTGKPPQLPPKTLLGMPSDVEAARQKLQAEKQKAAQAAAGAPTTGTPPRSQPSPIDPQRTLYGNPHAAPPGGSSGRAATSAMPPKLPPSQPFRPPSAASRSQPVAPTPASHPTQVARSPAIPASTSQPAHPAVRQGQTLAVSASPQLEAPANSRSGVQRTNTGVQAPAKPGPSTAPPSSTSSNRVPPANTAHSSAAPIALGSTEPDRERESSRPLIPIAVAPPAPQPTPLPQPLAAGGMMATRLASFERGALAPQSTSSAAPASAQRTSPQLSLNPADTTARKPAPVKRWPALSLLGLAVVAFGGVIVVRAPQLLPAPLAPLATLVAKQLRVAAPAVPTASPPAQAAPPAEMAQPPEGSAIEAPAALGGAASTAAPGAEVPTANAPEPAAQAAAPVPAAVQGDVAQLEKQAIDLLLANDYTAARASYERLHSAEPARPEYSVMLDLLAREIAPACGGPGQVPCAQP